MQKLIFIMLMGLLPLAAFAEEGGVESESTEMVDSLINEVEGTANTTVFIENLTINMNTGDLVSNRNGAGQESFGLLHLLIERLHGGFPGPGHPDAPGRHMDQPRMPPAVDTLMQVNPELLELMTALHRDVDPDVLRFVLRIGILASEDAEFRKHLRNLVERYRQGEKTHDRRTDDRHTEDR